MALGADGQMRGEGAFSGTTLLADQGDGFHGLNFIPSFRYDGKYIIPQALSTRIACRPPPRWSVLAVTPHYVYCYTLMERKRVRGLRGAVSETRDRRAQWVQSRRLVSSPVRLYSICASWLACCRITSQLGSYTEPYNH